MVATDRLFIRIDSCSNIEEVKNQFPELDFLTYLYAIFGFYNIPTSSIINKLNMNEEDYFNILDGKVSPTRDQILQLTKAINLDIKKTNFLLTLANKSTLNPKDSRDGLIIFSIKNHYNLKEINLILSNCHLQNIK